MLLTGHSLCGGLLLMMRCIRCILRPYRLGPQVTRFEGVLRFWRDSFGFSTAPADCTTGHSFCGSLTILKRFIRCILRPQPTGPQDTRFGGVLPFWKYLVSYSTAPADWTTGHSFFLGVLPFWRDSFGVFYGPADWLEKFKVQSLILESTMWKHSLRFWFRCRQLRNEIEHRVGTLDRPLCK